MLSRSRGGPRVKLRPFDTVREAEERTDSAHLDRLGHRHLPLRRAARCGAFADEERVVAGFVGEGTRSIGRPAAYKQVQRSVPTCRRPARPPRRAVGSSARVRVPGRVGRRGAFRLDRWRWLRRLREGRALLPRIASGRQRARLPPFDPVSEAGAKRMTLASPATEALPLCIPRRRPYR